MPTVEADILSLHQSFFQPLYFPASCFHSLVPTSRYAAPSGVASYRALGHVPPLTFNNFIFSSIWSKSDSQLSKLCIVYSLRDYTMQMSTTHSSSFDQYGISYKTIIIEQLLHPALKSTMNAHDNDIISIFVPPSNKS